MQIERLVEWLPLYKRGRSPNHIRGGYSGTRDVKTLRTRTYSHCHRVYHLESLLALNFWLLLLTSPEASSDLDLPVSRLD